MLSGDVEPGDGAGVAVAMKDLGGLVQGQGPGGGAEAAAVEHKEAGPAGLLGLEDGPAGLAEEGLDTGLGDL